MHNYQVVFNIFVYILIISYIVAFFALVHNGIKHCKYRPDELSRFLRMRLDDFKNNPRGKIDSDFLASCVIILVFIAYCCFWSLLFDSLTCSDKMEINYDIKQLAVLYFVLSLFNLVYLFDLLIIFECLIMKIKFFVRKLI